MSRIAFGTIACTLLLSTGAADAAVTYYPGFAPSFSTTGGESVTQSATTPLDPATGQFTDPDSGSPDATRTRYIGGTLNYSPNDNPQWGGSLTLNLLRSGPEGGSLNGIRIHKTSGGTNWRFDGTASDHTTTVAGSETFDFVVKIVDLNWNQTRVDLFYGANAKSDTEGTPDAFLNLVNANSASFIRDASVTFTAEDWATAPSSGSLSSFFTADTWTAVGDAAPVPEPTSIAGLGLAGLLALRRRSR
ncbi:MAG TPA: PEP-CTERM sorting domain-containing protein [Tepidisphaeraceae bacterium]|jgi:hypothetical protein|nr:PEP-CTERM sorting domain-containing protein [Tepidisphaeraceae bacterium]